MNQFLYNLVVDGSILTIFVLLLLFGAKHSMVLLEEILEKLNRLRKLQR